MEVLVLAALLQETYLFQPHPCKARHEFDTHVTAKILVTAIHTLGETFFVTRGQDKVSWRPNLLRVWFSVGPPPIFAETLILSIPFRRLSSSVIHSSECISTLSKWLFATFFFGFNNKGAVFGEHFATKRSRVNLGFPSGYLASLQF